MAALANKNAEPAKRAENPVARRLFLLQELMTEWRFLFNDGVLFLSYRSLPRITEMELSTRQSILPSGPGSGYYVEKVKMDRGQNGIHFQSAL
jgi:hypothetical protein